VTTPQKDTVDYRRLLQRLVAHACFFMRIFSADADLVVVDGIGKSATDFAADTLILFLDGQVSCDGNEDAILAYLKRVMERDILDARGSAAVKTTKRVQPLSGKTTDDGKVLLGLDDYPAQDAVDLITDGTEFKRRLYELLERGEPELYELVYAIFEENALTPREIATVIGTDSADVQNRKKRLRTFLAKQNIMKTPARASR
jgi:DNA-directed RNA polymerase specialized sigma24 family protein